MALNITIYNEVTAVPISRILTPAECRERLVDGTRSQLTMLEYWRARVDDLDYAYQLAYYSGADEKLYQRLKREKRVLV